MCCPILNPESHPKDFDCLVFVWKNIVQNDSKVQDQNFLSHSNFSNFKRRVLAQGLWLSDAFKLLNLKTVLILAHQPFIKKSETQFFSLVSGFMLRSRRQYVSIKLFWRKNYSKIVPSNYLKNWLDWKFEIEECQ